MSVAVAGLRFPLIMAMLIAFFCHKLEADGRRLDGQLVYSEDLNCIAAILAGKRGRKQKA